MLVRSCRKKIHDTKRHLCITSLGSLGDDPTLLLKKKAKSLARLRLILEQVVTASEGPVDRKPIPSITTTMADMSDNSRFETELGLHAFYKTAVN